MIPTSIDGTDITGATIDGQDVEEITVDGDTVFSAGPRIIDDFETGNLNAYTGATTSFSTPTFANAINGSRVLEESRSTLITIYSTSGLQNYPSPGTTFEYYYRDTNIDECQSAFHFGRTSGSNTYAIEQNQIQAFRINKFVNGNRTILDEVTYNQNDNEWYKYVVDWQQNGDITVEVFDENDNLEVTLSANDTTFTNSSIGFRARYFSGNSGTQRWDFVHIV